MKFALKDFLIYGKIGPIELGMPANEVENIIGKPDLVGGGSNKYPFQNIWKYGDIEFNFAPKERILMCIVLNFWENNYNETSGEKK